MEAGKGRGEKQWTAEEFWEIQNGGLFLRFPVGKLLKMEISEIIMETFTPGNAIGLRVQSGYLAISIAKYNETAS